MTPYNTPQQNLLGINISSIGNPILQEFISDGSGSINFFGGYIMFSTLFVGGTYSANDGDTLVFDNEVFTFRTNPTLNDLQAGVGLNRSNVSRLYQILKRHPRLSLKYDFSYDFTANQERVDYIAKVSGNEGKTLDNGIPTVPFFTGLAATTCLSNAYVPIINNLNNYTGQEEGYRGQIEMKTTTQVSGLESLFTSASQRDILLQRYWAGFDNGLQVPMSFDASLFMKKDLDTQVDFTQSIAYINNGALRKYQLTYGDFYDNTYTINNQYLNRYQVHNSFNFDETYWNRLPSTGLTTINFLGNRNNHYINPSQYNTLSQIQHYVPFDLGEPITNFQNTNLWLSYDLLFEDGTTSLNNVQPNITLASNSGQFTQDVSLYLINYQTLETTSRIKSITFTLNEYLPIDVIGNSRQVTNPITFLLNNELRCYQVDDNDPNNINNREQTQLYYQNSHGGFDTLFTHESTQITYATSANTYQYSNLNREVFDIDQTLVFQVTSDQLEEHEQKYVVNNLPNSIKVYIKMKDFDQQPCYILNSSNEYNNQTRMTKLTFNVALKVEQNNLTK